MAAGNGIQKIKAFLMLCYIILFIMDSFVHIKLWTILLAPIIITLFLASFPKAKSSNKYLSSILVISGVYLLIRSLMPLSLWAEALVKNAGLTVLLLSVPLLSIIFYLEDFSSHISNFARKHVKSSFSFYVFTFLIINFFGTIMNVASISMVHKLLESISGKHPKKVYYRALTRGFCLAQLWGPNFMAVAIILQYSELEWHAYAPFGILLLAAGMVLSIAMEKIAAKRHKDEVLSQTIMEVNETADGGSKGLIRAFGLSAFLIISIISIQYLSGKSILVVVPFASLAFPVLLALLFRKFCIYKERFKEYFNATLPNMNNEIILFTSVGFFGHALSISGADSYIPLIIKSTGISSSALLIPFIITLILMLSMIGLHPILIVSAISIAYSAGAIPLSQMQLATVFSTGYFAYTLLSPFSALILAVASLEHKNPLEVGINLNLNFWLLFFFLSSVVISFL